MELARLVHKYSQHALLLIISINRRPSKAEIADEGHFLSKPCRPDEVIREVHN